MKKLTRFLLIIFLLIPISVFAYSEYLIASGQNIGIELKADNVIIVGSYEINGYDVLKETDLQVGDKIIKINDITVHTAEDIDKILKNLSNNQIEITYLREKQENKITLILQKEDGMYKTGLYVKDTIRGVATLTYIDAENKKFGALGHEIIEKTTKSKFESKNGTIFESTVTGITKSIDGNPGEKNAKSYSDKIYGKVLENTTSGIFGNYTDSLPKSKLYKVVTPDEINLGKAQILTVTDGDKIESYDINILKINRNSNSKNILFEVTDKRLLEKTGGIVQGMSGSPIIQNDNIIGAVNFVLVERTDKGYGIFITNMLEEAEN